MARRLTKLEIGKIYYYDGEALGEFDLGQPMLVVGHDPDPGEQEYCPWIVLTGEQTWQIAASEVSEKPPIKRKRR